MAGSDSDTSGTSQEMHGTLLSEMEDRRLIRGVEDELGGTPQIERKRADLVMDHLAHRHTELA